MVQAVTPAATVASPAPAEPALTLEQRLAEACALKKPASQAGNRAKKRKSAHAEPGHVAAQQPFNHAMPSVFAHAPLKNGRDCGSGQTPARAGIVARLPIGVSAPSASTAAKLAQAKPTQAKPSVSQGAIELGARQTAANALSSAPLADAPGMAPVLAQLASQAVSAPASKSRALFGAEERERPGLTPDLPSALPATPSLPEKAAAPLPARPFAAEPRAAMHSENANTGPGLTYRFTRWGEQHTVKVQHSVGVDGQLNYRLQPSDALVGERLQQHLADAPGQTWLTRDARDQSGGQSRQQGESEAEDEDA